MTWACNLRFCPLTHLHFDPTAPESPDELSVSVHCHLPSSSSCREESETKFEETFIQVLSRLLLGLTKMHCHNSSSFLNLTIVLTITSKKLLPNKKQRSTQFHDPDFRVLLGQIQIHTSKHLLRYLSYSCYVYVFLQFTDTHGCLVKNRALQ